VYLVCVERVKVDAWGLPREGERERESEASQAVIQIQSRPPPATDLLLAAPGKRPREK